MLKRHNTYLSDTVSITTAHDQRDTETVNTIENELLNGNPATGTVYRMLNSKALRDQIWKGNKSTNLISEKRNVRN